jgi:hypothetical protein
LENFCNNGKLWVYDRENKQYRNQTPYNTAVQSHYYTFEDEKGNKNTDIEKGLSKIEGETGPIISKLNNREQITDKEKVILSVFIAFLMNRVPDFEKSVNVVNEHLVKQMIDLMFHDEEKAQSALDQYKRDTGKEFAGTAKDMVAFHKKGQYDIVTNRNLSLGLMLKLSVDIAIYFIQMEWLFLYAPDKKSFVTTDNPVAIVSMDDKQEDLIMGGGIIIQGTIKLVPLSQYICLVMFDRGNLIGYKNATREIVRKINIMIAMCTDRFLIGRDEALIRNLVNITKINQWERKGRFQIY